MPCFDFLKDKLYDQLITTQDAFACKCRKLMGVMSFSAQLLPLVTIPYLISASYDETSSGSISETTGLAIAMAGLCFMLLFTFVPTYLYVRTTGDAPEWLFDILILISNLALIPVTIGIKRFPTQPNLILFAMWVVFTGTPRLWLHMALLGVHYVVASYNSAIEDSDWFIMQVSGAYLGHPGGRLLQNLIGFVNSGCIVFIAVVMYRQLIAAVISAQTAVELAHIVAQQLLLYNTEGVRQTLESYDEKCDDKDLIEVFCIIAENLDEYRPYLPNYLLNFGNDTKSNTSNKKGGGNDDDDDDDDDEEEMSIVGDLSSVGSDNSLHNAKKENSGGGPSSPDKMLAADRTSMDSRQSKYKPGALMRPTRKGGDTRSMRSTTSTQQQPGSPLNATTGAATFQEMMLRTRQQGGECKVVIGVIHFGTVEGVLLSRQERTEALGKFVERVSDLAGVTSGAVHSFVGGQLIISWGAYPMHRPDSKSTQFLLSLSRDPGDKRIQPSGAVLSGMAEVQLAGGKRQQALTITMNWLRDVQDCALVAKKNNALVVDGRVFAYAKNDFDTRVCDVCYCPQLDKNGEYVRTHRPFTLKTPQMQSPMMNLTSSNSMTLMQQQYSGGAGPGGPLGAGSPMQLGAQSPNSFISLSNVNLLPTGGSGSGSNTQSGASNSSSSSQVLAAGKGATTIVKTKEIDDYVYNALVLYHVVKEHVDNHDEWLYELERKTQQTPEQLMESAVEKAIDGKFQEAVEIIDGIKDKALLDDPHVKRLIGRIKGTLHTITSSGGKPAAPGRPAPLNAVKSGQDSSLSGAHHLHANNTNTAQQSPLAADVPLLPSGQPSRGPSSHLGSPNAPSLSSARRNSGLPVNSTPEPESASALTPQSHSVSPQPGSARIDGPLSSRPNNAVNNDFTSTSGGGALGGGGSANSSSYFPRQHSSQMQPPTSLAGQKSQQQHQQDQLFGYQITIASG